MKAICVIPARGGSVGLARKNLRKVGGKSLVELAIDCAKAADCFSLVAVSSDDPEILKVALDAGALPVERPGSLSGGEIEVPAVLEHVVLQRKALNEEYDELCVLNPTSPLRSVEDVLLTRKAMHDVSRSVSGVSVKPTWPIPMRHIRAGKREAWHVARIPSSLRQRRPATYIQNGAVYWVKVPYLMEAHQLVGPRCGVHFMPQERSVDIDTYWDLLSAEAWYAELLRQRGAK